MSIEQPRKKGNEGEEGDSYEGLRQRIEKLMEENEGLKQTIEHLTHQLHIDALTGLYTRAYFEEEVQQTLAVIRGEVEHKRRDEVPPQRISIAFCDLDDFKKINDTFGHAAGDAVLQEVATALRENVRGSDIVSRFGGEEIVIAFASATEEEAVAKADALREKVAALSFPDYPDLQVSISVGVASSDAPGLEPEFRQLVEAADAAVYGAKEAGKNRVVPYSVHEEAAESGSGS